LYRQSGSVVAEGTTFVLYEVQGLGDLRKQVLYEVLESLLAIVPEGRGDKE